jgi:hypothetical protein
MEVGKIALLLYPNKIYFYSTTLKITKMEKLANVHPGEILYFEFPEPLEISAYRLSKEI